MNGMLGPSNKRRANSPVLLKYNTHNKRTTDSYFSYGRAPSTNGYIEHGSYLHRANNNAMNNGDLFSDTTKYHHAQK